MTTRALFAAGLLTYAALAVADFGLTRTVVQTGAGYESNPVAAVWLERYGWPGLAWYKALTAAVFAAAAVLIARRRARTGLLVLAFGCVASAWVVVHSAGLLMAQHQGGVGPPPHMARM